MKTLCIKTNNQSAIMYLLNELRLSNLQNMCFTKKEFKHYQNIIIHYWGTDEATFIRYNFRYAFIPSY